jgi:hypothetical protein
MSSPANATTNTAKNTASKLASAANSAGKQVANAVNKIPFMKTVGEKSGIVGIVIVIIVVLIVLIIVLIYLYKMLMGNDLKETLMIDTIISLEKPGSLPYKIDSQRLATTSRGQEFSYSFWIYLQEVQQVSEANKLIFSRNNTESNNFSAINTSANPIVMMDAKTNKMYIAMSTTNADGVTINMNSIPLPSSGFVVATIDYVPLQRWVHVIMVIKDGNLMIFMDGDLYTIKGVQGVNAPEGKRPLIRGTSGDVLVGNPKNTIQGFMGKFQFYNYALSTKQIKNIYQAGPISKSWLAFFGMGNYKLQSPIVQIK